jgi:predicted Zn-dependent peptidase
MDVRVGSNSDPREIQGLAHMLEHMLFLGNTSILRFVCNAHCAKARRSTRIIITIPRSCSRTEAVRMHILL